MFGNIVQIAIGVEIPVVTMQATQNMIILKNALVIHYNIDNIGCKIYIIFSLHKLFVHSDNIL